MYFRESLKFEAFFIKPPFWQVNALLLILFLSFFSLFGQNPSLNLNEKNEIVIDEIKDAEVFAFGKTIIVKREVKGVLVFGGNIVIEGKVEGDVAAIGGSVIQKENGFVGGDVIIFGGKYQHERSDPLRNSDKETIIYAGYEEELRSLTQNPSQILYPQLSWSFLGWRLLSVLFWFIVSLVFTTIAPGAVSRAVANFQLSALKVMGFGLLTLILLTLTVIMSLSYLPAGFSGIISLMAFILVALAYFFGRVSLQFSLGKWIQKKVVGEKLQSESFSLFIGSLAMVFLLSLPYVWMLAVVLLFSASLGLVIMGRSLPAWNKS